MPAEKFFLDILSEMVIRPLSKKYEFHFRRDGWNLIYYNSQYKMLRVDKIFIWKFLNEDYSMKDSEISDMIINIFKEHMKIEIDNVHIWNQIHIDTSL